MEYDSGYDLAGTDLRSASAWEEEEEQDGDEVAGGGVHQTQAEEGSKGSGEKSIPDRVGAGMAPVAIDEHPLFRFDSSNRLDLVSTRVE